MSNDSVPDVLGFDHAGLSVSDLERSHQFYADVFGFNLFAQRGSQPRKRLDPTVGAMQRGWFQFALSTKDIKASYARVVAAGAAPLMPPRVAPDGRTLCAFVGDPDGNLVEQLQRSPPA
jgi:catechol 2,3-dioxygenase-like lactoylglutathione lyase family enzyme